MKRLVMVLCALAIVAATAADWVPRKCSRCRGRGGRCSPCEGTGVTWEYVAAPRRRQQVSPLFGIDSVAETPSQCTSCGGRGGNCTRCAGTGKEWSNSVGPRVKSDPVAEKCYQCRGKGGQCSACRGTGTVWNYWRR
jgi:hypothetical protein